MSTESRLSDGGSHTLSTISVDKTQFSKPGKSTKFTKPAKSIKQSLTTLLLMNNSRSDIGRESGFLTADEWFETPRSYLDSYLVE